MCYFNKSSKTSESAGCAKAPKIVKISIFRRLPIQADLILWGKILAIFCVIPDQKPIHEDLPSTDINFYHMAFM